MTRAAAVSAALSRAGIRSLGSGSSRNREGIRVSQSFDRVYVAVDIDSDRLREERTVECWEALAAAGYTLEAAERGIYATKEAGR